MGYNQVATTTFENKTMSDLMQAISTLPVDEKIRLIDAIWADIGQTRASVELSDEQRAAIDRRIAEFCETEYLDEDEVWRRVNSQVTK